MDSKTKHYMLFKDHKLKTLFGIDVLRTTDLINTLLESHIIEDEPLQDIPEEKNEREVENIPITRSSKIVENLRSKNISTQKVPEAGQIQENSINNKKNNVGEEKENSSDSGDIELFINKNNPLEYNKVKKPNLRERKPLSPLVGPPQHEFLQQSHIQHPQFSKQLQQVHQVPAPALNNQTLPNIDLKNLSPENLKALISIASQLTQAKN